MRIFILKKLRIFRKIILVFSFISCLHFTLKAQPPCANMSINPVPGYDCITSALILTINVISPTTPPPYTLISTPAGINTVMATNSVVLTGIPTQTGPVTYYFIKLLAVSGCTNYTTVSYSNPTASTAIALNYTPVTCHGGSNGGVSATYSGGGPYTWQWSTGATTQMVSGLSPGTYSVAITNSAGCTATTNVNVLDPGLISSVLNPSFIPCYGGTVNAVVTTTGGSMPYSYTVNGTALPTPTTPVTGLMAGVHTIITKDNKNCVETSNVQLNQAAQQVITPTVTPPLCHGQSNAALSISVSGPVAGYSYTWTPGGSSGTSLSNIPAGNYTLSVKDASSCITRSVITVPNTAPATPVPIIHKENCSAADGAFTLNAVGGTAPYTYTTLPNSLGSTVSGLSSGIYTVVIGDANGCRDTGTVFVGNLSLVTLNVLTVTPVKCYNVCDGSVLLSVANAAQPVSYSISGMAMTTNSLITNLCAGFYLVKAIDNNGCPAFDTINFPSPPAFSYSATSSAAICIGRKAQLAAQATGGSGNLTYLWNPGAYNGATVYVEPTSTTSYSLNVYDSQGCTQAPYGVTVNVNPKITINVSNSNAGICPGTTAQITPSLSGGDGNYTYTWLPGNSHGSSIFVENITVPNYTLIVGDGCDTPKESKVISIKLHPVTKPLYREVGEAGCTPYCATFINATPGSKDAIWNYGDQPLENIGDTTYYCYKKAGNYNLRLSVTDSNSCRSAFTYTNAVKVLPRPETSFVTEPGVITLNDAENVLFRNTGEFVSSYQWYVNNAYAGSGRNMNYTFRDTGCYDIRLLVQSENLCKDSTVRSICVFEGFNFYMPNAFSPNNDGINDLLLPKGSGWLYDNYKLEIFNRWGIIVFSTNDVNQGWDGGVKTDEFQLEVLKADPNNFYNWRALVTDNQKQEHVLKGSVMLLR